MKHCGKCDTVKDDSEFYKNPTNTKDGLFAQCKPCRALWTKRYYSGARERILAYNKELRHRLKLETFERYGGARCACCGEDGIVFLSIDHIHGGGIRHRREIGISGSGYNLVLWLKKNGFPPGYQVLCHNCNQAKHICGVCPHQAAKAVAA